MQFKAVVASLFSLAVAVSALPAEARDLCSGCGRVANPDLRQGCYDACYAAGDVIGGFIPKREIEKKDLCSGCGLIADPNLKQACYDGCYAAGGIVGGLLPKREAEELEKKDLCSGCSYVANPDLQSACYDGCYAAGGIIGGFLPKREAQGDPVCLRECVAVSPSRDNSIACLAQCGY